VTGLGTAVAVTEAVAEREPLFCFSLLSQPKKKISPTKQKIEPITDAVFDRLLLDLMIPDSDTTVLRHEQDRIPSIGLAPHRLHLTRSLQKCGISTGTEKVI
jgi:hypothetical protein